MIKKIFIVSSILLFLAVIFFAVYNFAFRDIEKIKSVTVEKEKEIVNKKIEAESDIQNIKVISESSVIAPTLDKDGKKIIFYNKDNGDVEEIAFDGSVKRVIFENNLENLVDVQWSPDKNFVISRFEKDNRDKFYLYSYVTRKSTELKGGLDSVVWDNQGEKIIYKYFDKNSGERSLNISDPDGKNWQNMLSLGEKFKRMLMVQVPQTLFVSYWNYPDAFQETSLGKINIVGEKEERLLLSGKFGANYLWSPDGRNFLISSVNRGGYNIKLELGNDSGEIIKDLNMPTLAEKCVWGKNSKDVYCALPSNVSEEVLLPNDYQEKKFLTKDTFWKINTENNTKERVVELEELSEAYDAVELFLSPQENILFFINRYNDKLYRIIL